MILGRVVSCHKVNPSDSLTGECLIVDLYVHFVHSVLERGLMGNLIYHYTACDNNPISTQIVLWLIVSYKYRRKYLWNLRFTEWSVWGLGCEVVRLCDGLVVPDILKALWFCVVAGTTTPVIYCRTLLQLIQHQCQSFNPWYRILVAGVQGGVWQIWFVADGATWNDARHASAFVWYTSCQPVPPLHVRSVLCILRPLEVTDWTKCTSLPPLWWW